MVGGSIQLQAPHHSTPHNTVRLSLHNGQKQRPWERTKTLHSVRTVRNTFLWFIWRSTCFLLRVEGLFAPCTGLSSPEFHHFSKWPTRGNLAQSIHMQNMVMNQKDPQYQKIIGALSWSTATHMYAM